MKKLTVFLLIIALIGLFGCSTNTAPRDLVATTLPVYDFTSAICDGTKLQIGRLVTENVSCLHDYTLQVNQMRIIEGANAVIISGAGLEEFLDDALHSSQTIIDASAHAHIHSAEHNHEHEHKNKHGHDHLQDPHIWLSPENAKIMSEHICAELTILYPEYRELFQSNLTNLLAQIDAVQAYGDAQLSDISCRELITFHDGFAYFAESFDLTILEAVEEESGSEASAAEIIHLIELVDDRKLPAVFTELNGSDACASIIRNETGVKVFALDMAMSGDSYFDAMYHNINTIKEALG